MNKLNGSCDLLFVNRLFIAEMKKALLNVKVYLAKTELLSVFRREEPRFLEFRECTLQSRQVHSSKV